MNEKLSPAVAKAYQHLLDNIIAFNLAPGQHINDNQISKELEISRAPVREAIRILVSNGLIQSCDGKWIVSPISIDDIADILHIRAALEAECIRLIAASGWLSCEQEQELIRLQQTFVSTKDTPSIHAHYQADDAFHARLVSFAKSPRIGQIMEQLRLQMQRARWLCIAVPQRRGFAVNEHASILTALLDHDLDCAVSCMQEHMKNSEQSFYQVLSSTDVRMLADAFKSMNI